MNLAIALTAARHGATIANHVKVTKLHKTAGKLSGASLRVSYVAIGRFLILCSYITQIENSDTRASQSALTHLLYIVKTKMFAAA